MGAVPGAPRPMTAMAPARVGLRPYDRWRVDGGQVVLIPAVPGADGAPDIPGRLVAFGGYAPTVGVSIRQANEFIEGDGRATRVAGLTRYAVTLDDATVYSPVRPSASIFEALHEAAEATRRLLSHPVRWQDAASWSERACSYQGIPATVRAYLPMRGEVLLEAAPGRPFPGGADRAWTDILSDRVAWESYIEEGDRERTEPGAAAGAGPDDGTELVPDRPGPDEP